MQNHSYNAQPTSPTDNKENSVTKKIEDQTSQIPSAYFLAAAGGAVLLSLIVASTERRSNWGTFIGNWVPSILLLGLYNKIVKTHEAEEERNLHPQFH